MPLESPQLFRQNTALLLDLEYSYAPKKSLQHLAIWEKSSKLCSIYHLGTPPCFFPAHFSPNTAPQPVNTLPLFVQQCPSYRIYLQFSKMWTAKKERQLMQAKSADSGKTQLLNIPLLVEPLLNLSGSTSPVSLLSSTYSSHKLVSTHRLDCTFRYSAYCECKNSSKNEWGMSTSGLGTSCDTAVVPLTKLSLLQPAEARPKYLALNINQRLWESADYRLVKLLTEQYKELIALVVEELASQNSCSRSIFESGQ